MQSPTASPILPSMPALPNTPVLAVTPLAPPVTVSKAPQQDLYPVVSHNTADVCPAAECNQTRIHVACPRHLCCKHCVAAGGCTLKSHTTTGQPPASQLALVATTGLSSEDPADNSIAMPSQVPQEVPVISSLGGPPMSLPAPAMQSNAAMVDPQPNPHFISHIEPIFMQQYGCEQQLQESNWVVEVEHQQCAKLTKQAIVVYAWYEVCFILMSR
jgi:hypothetical protein